MEMDDEDREFLRARKYFRSSSRLQRLYQQGDLAGPDAVAHLASVLRTSRRSAWRHLKLLEFDLDRAAERRRRQSQDAGQMPSRSRSGLGYVAASAAAAIGGLALGILSGYKGKYK